MREELQTGIATPETFPQAYARLKAYLRENRTLKDFQFAYKLLQGFENDPGRQPFTREVRCAALTSYTVDFVLPLLKVDLMLSDIRSDFYRPHFNQFRQEVLNPDSGLYRYQPDIALVAFNLEDVGENPLDLFDSIARTFRANAPAKCSLLLQDLTIPLHAYDPLVRCDGGARATVERVNAGLREVAARYPNTYVMEYSRVVNECGARTWTDPRTWFTARIPVAQQNWLPLSEAYAAYIRSLLNIDVKCVVLDLDHTLWGGVLGEDGFDGIAIGETYPGNVFRKFQQYLLDLSSNGYILAISSKNNAEDVMHVLRDHPAMVLREQNFAAIRANWRPKEQNILEISKEIQISPDHMLFVDDNPIEIQKVKAAIPEIRCLQLDSPPMNFPRQFEELRCLGKILLTEEDRQRGQQYFDDRKRREFKESAETLDDFYKSLGQKLTIHINNEKHRARIAQLSQRTNQFNMTTIRLTESNVQEMMSNPDYLLLTADLGDSFGDSGTVVYVQVKKTDGVWLIENYLMSCRVLGRTVEESVLNYLAERAKSAGVHSLQADYVPTRKNQPFAGFYAGNGFAELEGNSSGALRYGCRIAEWTPRPSYAAIVENLSVV